MGLSHTRKQLIWPATLFCWSLDGERYARHAIVKLLFHFVFPKSYDMPTGLLQLAIHAPVPLTVSANLLIPKFRV